METLFYICFLLILLGIMMWGVVSALLDATASKETGIRTTGVVVRNQVCWGRITVVRPIIRFQTHSGQQVELLSKSGVAFILPQYTAGQSVEVVYNPADPTDFTIA